MISKTTKNNKYSLKKQTNRRQVRMSLDLHGFVILLLLNNQLIAKVFIAKNTSL